jgi:hypothetical protein
MKRRRVLVKIRGTGMLAQFAGIVTGADDQVAEMLVCQETVTALRLVPFNSALDRYEWWSTGRWFLREQVTIVEDLDKPMGFSPAYLARLVDCVDDLLDTAEPPRWSGEQGGDATLEEIKEWRRKRDEWMKAAEPFRLALRRGRIGTP